MMRTSSFAYQQPAAQIQRWAWKHFGASLPADPPLFSEKRSLVFLDAVETFSKNTRSALARPLLIPPSRCFKSARKPGDDVVTYLYLTKCEQACWVGSAVAASVAGAVGYAVGVVVGAWRVTVAPPDGRQARAYYAAKRDTWQLREDAARATFLTQMAAHRDTLPAWLELAVAAYGETASPGAHEALQQLRAHARSLPTVMDADTAVSFLSAAEKVLWALSARPLTSNASYAEGNDNAQRKAADTLEALFALSETHAQARRIRRSASYDAKHPIKIDCARARVGASEQI